MTGCFRRGSKIIENSLLHLDTGGHGDHSMKLSAVTNAVVTVSDH